MNSICFMADQYQDNQNFDNQNPVEEAREQFQQTAEGTENAAREAAENAGSAARETQAQMQAAVEKTEGAVQRTIDNVKSRVPNPAPEATKTFKTQSTAFDVKSRLLWGEPGLTIIDVRDRDSFNELRIMGAIAAPMQQGNASEQMSTLEANRDIYVYGASDAESNQVAQELRNAGFRKVAIIEGGLDAWMDIAGPTEGRASLHKEPGQSEFNIMSRLQEYSEMRGREAAQASS